MARRYALQVEYGGTDREVHRITPAVSVLVVTYQHAPFIADCLDGILAQQTDFPFEVIIGEDGSDDGTRETLHRLRRRPSGPDPPLPP